MKAFLSEQFYQRYFSAVRRQHADWLGLVPEQARLDMLAHLTQWDLRLRPTVDRGAVADPKARYPDEGSSP
ncbi:MULTISPECIES: glucose uptake inhibitor SgrT [unclassified Serratia (in: enterobacteria)]|uniref:glucose uptake inhibitor SgrT n=1 Tax=unclassified Serratia (in: enterobacteria) TaxID=2647522 RepID=UPI002ECFF3CE|nr:glucose uptake inhibitor SgrT [Serratia sp. C2(2)]MEE4448477.1 glucose uptake inhibitor SgrT [Serratia sp. C2(1)]